MEADFSLLSDDFEDCLTCNYDILLRSPFRLLDLPPELWLLVCEYAVIRSAPFVVGRESELFQMARILRQPSITRTSRLLRVEALPIFYAVNEFEMIHNFSVPCPRHFLTAIGGINLRTMGSLLMHSNCDKDFWEGTCQRGGIKCEVEMVGTNLRNIGSLSWNGLNTFRINFK
ncbi:hypothetical protein Slin15195_G011090 [Septoria linicola]|uniref:F-box domain-containing protein n=1 Tax=Septoria linicola TaxID=215465 RepID=A0A9Q9EEE6_9PEZI|nr:hypothetical protein Slin14017_G011100 [Septoria linicola]USW47790.1 hypothetical protein Slin15195_G011090 [Septoria linicola]